MPFPKDQEIYASSLIMDEPSIEKVLQDIKSLLSSNLIQHEIPFNASQKRSIKLLFFTLDDFKEAFCVLMLSRSARKSEDACDVWTLSIRLWGWISAPLAPSFPLIESIKKQILHAKLMCLKQYASTHPSVLVTDDQLVQWLKSPAYKSQTIVLHSICTISAFFSFFFDILKKNGRIPLETTTNAKTLDDNTPVGVEANTGEKVYIGEGFDFMSGSTSRVTARSIENKEITLIEFKLHQTFNSSGVPCSKEVDASVEARPVTCVINDCGCCHVENRVVTLDEVTKHIPQSLNGNLASSLYPGLEIGYKIWCMDIVSEEKRVDLENKMDIELIALAKQARME